MHASLPALAALLLALAPDPARADAGTDSHRDAVRDYLIVKHCGLDSDAVRAGFRIEIIALLGDGEIAASIAQTDRHAAAEEVRREWRNRGMGNRDPRCLSKGRAAVERFLTVLEPRE